MSDHTHGFISKVQSPGAPDRPADHQPHPEHKDADDRKHHDTEPRKEAAAPPPSNRGQA